MVPLFHTIAVVTAYWCIVYTVDKAFKTFPPSRARYVQWLEDYGISISFANMRCYTTKLNGVFQLWGECGRRGSRAWFDIGVALGLVLMVTSVLVLVYSLYQALFGNSDSDQVLTPMMPGVNIPWNQLMYYFVTLVICGVFHEIGHALAAVTENVRINGFGVFIFFLYPGAFVDLHSDHLAVISPRRQLRIYCAGVWHNIILSFVTYLVLLSLPLLLLPFYATNEGAAVVDASASILHDKLTPGTAITRVNDCSVQDTKDWIDCLDVTSSAPLPSYCASVGERTTYLLNQTTVGQDGGRDCCSTSVASTDICFEFLGPATSYHGNGKDSSQSFQDGENMLLNHHSNNGDTPHGNNGDTPHGNNRDTPYHRKFTCLTARDVVSHTLGCSTSFDCHIPNTACVQPSLGDHTHLIKLTHTGEGDPVLFLGDPHVLKYSISLSDYLPLSSAPTWLPSLLHNMCVYIVSISAALALLNIAPAYALDGQWALSAVLESLMPDHRHRNWIFNGVLMLGSLLLVFNIILAFWTLFNW